LGGTASQIDRLKSALSQEDAATAEREAEAHSIKGSAAAFGAELLREIAFRVERLASEEALDMASDALVDLGQEWTQIVQELQRVLTKGMPQSSG
jgi:HPt (histidine-containing phosphotransfer) domain-containing protein